MDLITAQGMVPVIQADTVETIRNFFSGATGASALLSGFSFAAALQLLGSSQKGRGVTAACILLYTSTFLFLFGIVGFNNAAVRPIDGELVIFQYDDGLFGGGRQTYTKAFYQAYAPEFILVGVAGLAFISGAITSAWTYSPVIGRSVLAIVIMIGTIWGLWFNL